MSASGTLKKIDDGLADGEAAIAAFVLLLMIVLAATQALLYNVATRFEVDVAQSALLHLEWIDDFLQKGTLWLAFLGASLATHKDQHIGIDVMHRIFAGRIRLLMKMSVALVSSVTCFFLSRVFFATALGAQERPFEYELLTSTGQVHICDGSVQLVADAGLTRPDFFCGVRHYLDLLGAPVETPVGALQLIVPAMFLWMSVRFGARFVTTTLHLIRHEDDPDEAGPTIPEVEL